MAKVIKKIIKATCWSCNGKKCKACHNTGKWEESIYYIIVKDKNGKEYAIDSDFIA